MVCVNFGMRFQFLTKVVQISLNLTAVLLLGLLIPGY